MLTALLLAASLTVADSPRSVDGFRECGIIEINHLHDEFGAQLLTQVIVWDWDWSEDRHRIRTWCKAPRHAVPQRRGDRWELTLLDSQGRRLVLSAPVWRETWTQEDPEAEERHCEFRRPLRWPRQ